MKELYTLRFGTRGSDLALWQTNHVLDLLRLARPDLVCEIEIIKTRGDHIIDTPLPLIGGKGLFTEELETALYSRRIDCAVHSLKDLPTEQPDGLTIGAILLRANPADVLVSRAGYTLDTLPEGARVGTSSSRRAAQLLRKRPDLKISNIRGNVNTRIRKGLDLSGEYDAIVLARAGVERLGSEAVITQVLDFEAMLPAPGQGSIAVQCRSEAALLAAIQPIHHCETALGVTAERAFLAGIGGGCSVPVAAYAHFEDDTLHLRGRVTAVDGSQQIDVELYALVVDDRGAHEAGLKLAQDALTLGAEHLVESQ